jgi:hypothetical protein
MQNKYSEYYPEYPEYPEYNSERYYSEKYSLTDMLGKPTPISNDEWNTWYIGELQKQKQKQQEWCTIC